MLKSSGKERIQKQVEIVINTLLVGDSGIQQDPFVTF